MYQAQYTLYVYVHYVYKLGIPSIWSEGSVCVECLLENKRNQFSLRSPSHGDNGDPLYGIIYCR